MKGAAVGITIALSLKNKCFLAGPNSTTSALFTPPGEKRITKRLPGSSLETQCGSQPKSQLSEILIQNGSQPQCPSGGKLSASLSTLSNKRAVQHDSQLQEKSVSLLAKSKMVFSLKRSQTRNCFNVITRPSY